ncbi:hypothetical protein MP638_000141 [Amoeboaphelidium occidentale]|nr:hypothetical protein MP638_000141 [Amoeboaphelidium occidentale]
MSAWNFRAPLSKDEKAVISDVETIREDSELQKHESASLLGNPLKVAEIALHRMIIECGWKQDDDEVKWDHIGLLPTFVNGEWLLKPVMIDLARVTEIKDESREEVYKHHLGILKKSMPSEQTEE